MSQGKKSNFVTPRIKPRPEDGSRRASAAGQPSSTVVKKDEKVVAPAPKPVSEGFKKD